MATNAEILSSKTDNFEENQDSKNQQKQQKDRPQKPKKKRRYAISEELEESTKKRKKTTGNNLLESNDEFGHPIPDLYPELYETIEDIERSPSPEQSNDLKSMDSQPIGVKKKRKTGSKDGKNVIEEDSEDEKPQQRIGSWVQCCRPECGKWRCLNVTVDAHDLEDKWVCAMNPDVNFNTCDALQEAFDSQDSEYDVIYTSFPEGSIVWAKMAGYPWWPGMMEDDPDYGYYCETEEENSRIPTSYHVVFFDKDVSRAWVNHYNIRPFKYNDVGEEQGSVVFRGKSYKKKLDQATEQAREALVLPPHDRLNVFGFAKRYGGKIGRPKKTAKEKKPKEPNEEKKPKDDTKESLEDSPNSLDIFMELSEEFQASESSDNFSQEIQKPTKKKTTPKTKETKSSEKKVFLAVKSTAGSCKAPIKEPGTKGRGRPPKTAAGGSAAKTPKGAKETQKSIDIEEKKEVNIEQCSSNVDKVSSKDISANDTKKITSEEKTSIQNTKDQDPIATSAKKDKMTNPKKRKLNQYKEEQQHLEMKNNQEETEAIQTKSNPSAFDQSRKTSNDASKSNKDSDGIEGTNTLCQTQDEANKDGSQKAVVSEEKKSKASKTKKKSDASAQDNQKEKKTAIPEKTNKKPPAARQPKAKKKQNLDAETKNVATTLNEHKDSTETLSEVCSSDEKINQKPPAARQPKSNKKTTLVAQPKTAATKSCAQPCSGEKNSEVDTMKVSTPKKKPALSQPKQKQHSNVKVVLTNDDDEELSKAKPSTPGQTKPSEKPRKTTEGEKSTKTKKSNKEAVSKANKKTTFDDKDNNLSSKSIEIRSTQSANSLDAKEASPQASTKWVHVPTPMPKLIKPTFKPPSKVMKEPKAKKMPKLAKTQFVQPGPARDEVHEKKKEVTKLTKSEVVPDEKEAKACDINTDPVLSDEVEVELAKLDKDIENMKKTIKSNDEALEKLRCSQDSPEF